MENQNTTQSLSFESKAQAQAATDLFRSCVESLPKNTTRPRPRGFVASVLSAVAALSVLAGCATELGSEEVTATEARVIDTSICPDGYNIIIGTETRDILAGTAGNDCIFGLGGNDNISGKLGNDILVGGNGDDILNGNQGDDVLYGEAGNDSLVGALGNDELYGGDGNDVLDANEGDDFAEGGPGNDLIDGDIGNDILSGGDDNDSIVDLFGTNVMNGGSGLDACNGNACDFPAPVQSCTVTADCGGQGTCNGPTNLCVRCTSNAQCGAGMACNPTQGCVGEMQCDDEEDDDQDGAMDCADSDCASAPQCALSLFDFGPTADITGGYHHQCSLHNGAVYCWGNNRNKELGYVTAPQQQSKVARPVQDLNGYAVAVVAGEEHTCAIMDDTTVKCWGNNEFGQLGDTSLLATNSLTPVTVTGLTEVATLALGQSHSCAIRFDGTVTCWGSNLYGQLGNGTFAPTAEATTVQNLTDTVGLAAGALHTCAVKSNGSVVCWGRASSGQLGDGNPAANDASLPVAVALTGRYDAISAGQAHTCAVRTDDTVYCWGWNSRGQVGDGTRTNRPAPVQVPGVTGVKNLSVGLQHTCVINTSGTVQCWGRNSDGQLGNGTVAENVIFPTYVTDLNNAARLASGGAQTCAKTTEGDVLCWGNGQYNATTNATTADVLSPINVSIVE